MPVGASLNLCAGEYAEFCTEVSESMECGFLYAELHSVQLCLSECEDELVHYFLIHWNSNLSGMFIIKRFFLMPMLASVLYACMSA